ncbi:hypothetical protein LBMAG53_12830 [Planctomycetota bacterium]|nr:hypothetical protein LBMAG53_12830 [Planctomycetota bacterium]
MNPDPEVLIHDWCRGELSGPDRAFLLQWLETQPDAKRRFRDSVIEFRLFAQASHEESISSRVDQAARRNQIPALALNWRTVSAAAALAVALGACAMISLPLFKSNEHGPAIAQAKSQSQSRETIVISRLSAGAPPVHAAMGGRVVTIQVR